jgi:hypothetical protein
VLDLTLELAAGHDAHGPADARFFTGLTVLGAGQGLGEGDAGDVTDLLRDVGPVLRRRFLVDDGAVEVHGVRGADLDAALILPNHEPDGNGEGGVDPVRHETIDVGVGIGHDDVAAEITGRGVDAAVHAGRHVPSALEKRALEGLGGLIDGERYALSEFQVDSGAIVCGTEGRRVGRSGQQSQSRQNGDRCRRTFNKEPHWAHLRRVEPPSPTTICTTGMGRSVGHGPTSAWGRPPRGG